MNLLQIFKSALAPLPRVSPLEASRRLQSGDAVLVDVREPHECADGIVDSAVLLPLSDLNGSRTHWNRLLRGIGGREMILYCASGKRTCVAGNILASEGFRVVNGGGFQDWVKAGCKTVLPSAATNELGSARSASNPKERS